MVGRSHPADQDRDVERERLVDFRQQLYGCFGARADALFELGDAVLCAGGPVTSLVELCQEKRFRYYSCGSRRLVCGSRNLP